MAQSETSDDQTLGTGNLRAGNSSTGDSNNDEMEPVMVLLSFKTEAMAELMDALSEYVGLSRGQLGCRNIDFVASVTTPGRIVIVQKWESAEAQQRHFDSPEMVAMAQRTVPLLTAQPDIDLFEGISMHDLA